MERWISKVCTRKRTSLNILERFDNCNESDYYGRLDNYGVSIFSFILFFSTEFIHGVSLFSVKGDRDKKLRCKSDSCKMVFGSHSMKSRSIAYSNGPRKVFI